jgi:hypothetical protein
VERLFKGEAYRPYRLRYIAVNMKILGEQLDRWAAKVIQRRQDEIFRDFIKRKGS